MRSYLFLALLMLTLICAPVTYACEECATHYDPVSETFCPNCEWGYCGAFGCTIADWEVFGSTCTMSGDGCFEYEGVAKGWCGPDQVVRFGAPASTRDHDWQLLNARVLDQPATGLQRAHR